MIEPSTIDELRAQAREADYLHERSRAMLVNAVRSGAALGLTQREIAAAIDRSQPEVSRLLRFHGQSRLGRTLSKNRRAVLDVARAHGASNIRVFGSVARGTDTAESDIDLLADLSPGTGLFGLARLERDLGEILGAKVDVVPANGLRNQLARQVVIEAVPL